MRDSDHTKADVISIAMHKPLRSSGIANVVVASTGNPGKPDQVTFDRRELNEILRVYSFMVAGGEWRDYAIDHLKDRAVFSVFRKASESALLTIEKDPRLSRRQGAYSVRNHAGLVLKRGQDLRQVLRHFDKQLKLVT